MATAFAAEPRDRTRTEHIARVERIAFRNDDDTFVILGLQDSLTAMGSASENDFQPGVLYRFLGKWEDDQKYGPRFRFSTYVTHGFMSKVGLSKYLCDLCPGIGPKAVDKLWLHFGGDTVKKLREEPVTVAGRCCLNVDVCEEASIILNRHKATESTKIELNGLFGGRGFSGKLIEESIDRWGVNALPIIKANPFRLLGMTSAGFKRCDKLYLDEGHRPEALKRQAICAVEAVRRDRQGHSWFPAEDLAAKLSELIPLANPVKAFKLALRAKMLAKLREGHDGTGKLWLTSMGRAMAERLIAAHVARLSRHTPDWPTGVMTQSQEPDDGLPSEHQLTNLLSATAGMVGLFCGGPGTGKTHTLGYLLRAILARVGGGNVKVLAPTGKAAVQARKALKAAGVDLATSTIHSALIQCGAMSMSGNDSDDMDGFGGDDRNRLESKYLIVDEASMIDANLMAVLLSACPTGTHVLFVGDPYQLPPVGHGSPLRDLIAAGLPYGELTEIRRNSGRIVLACHSVKRGEEFATSETINLDATPAENLRLIESSSEKESVETLESILRSMTKFHPVWETQVVIARNKGGMLTRKELNERLQGLLNPDGECVAGNPFRVGDKIMSTKNCKQQQVAIDPWLRNGTEGNVTNATKYNTVKDNRTNETVEKYLANGEIGRVVAIASKQFIAHFPEADALVRVPMGSTKTKEERGGDDEADEQGRGCNFDLAYAVTCHKLQGSSAPCVIVMGDEKAGAVTTREWLYTAISRAAKVCLMIGSKSVFTKMVGRVSTTRRKTFLTEQLKEAMSTNG